MNPLHGIETQLDRLGGSSVIDSDTRDACNRARYIIAEVRRLRLVDGRDPATRLTEFNACVDNALNPSFM